MPSFNDGRPLIVYDGVCVLCSGFVRFVFERDRSGRFLFTAAQSPLGQGLYRHYGLDPEDFETNLLIEDGRLHTKTAAFAGITAHLPWPWRLCALARCLPRQPADWLYDRVARNRYRLFGRTEHCMIPTPEQRSRFLD